MAIRTTGIYKPKATTIQVIKAISEQSSLTVEQVTECFKTYRALIEKIAESPKPVNYCVSLPYMGSFKFDRRKRPNKKFSGVCKYKKPEDMVMKDEYDYLCFCTNVALRESIKTISYEKIKRQKSIEGKIDEDMKITEEKREKVRKEMDEDGSSGT